MDFLVCAELDSDRVIRCLSLSLCVCVCVCVCVERTAGRQAGKFLALSLALCASSHCIELTEFGRASCERNGESQRVSQARLVAPLAPDQPGPRLPMRAPRIRPLPVSGPTARSHSSEQAAHAGPRARPTLLGRPTDPTRPLHALSPIEHVRPPPSKPTLYRPK